MGGCGASTDRPSVGRVSLRLAAAAVGLLGMFGVGCSDPVSDKSLRRMTSSELRQLIAEQSSSREPSLRLMDVRTPDEFAEGRIPGAVNVSLQQFPSNSTVDPRLARFATIVVYGENRASAGPPAVAKRLKAIGYEGVRLYDGGFLEWVRDGGKVER